MFLDNLFKNTLCDKIFDLCQLKDLQYQIKVIGFRRVSKMQFELLHKHEYEENPIPYSQL